MSLIQSCSFIDGAKGRLFSVLRTPAEECSARGSVLCLPPFAEELNKCRRMMALQSKALAADGYRVLMLDLYGTGDSEGDFGETDFEIWRGDAECGLRWLETRHGGPLYVWGVRAGCLLAASLADAVAGLILWQPVLRGEMALTEFLRIASVSEMFGHGGERTTPKHLRARLEQGETLEVAGYALGPRLASGMDAVRLEPPAGDGLPVHWLEVGLEARDKPTPAVAAALSRWAEAGSVANYRSIVGEQFWKTLEIGECPALIDATRDCLREQKTPP